MSESPKVSVITPTYNRAALLPRAVDSVLAQTFQDFELLIIDDCSTDDTQEVIAGFADPRVRSFRHETNRGLSAAFNTGLANARGEYIAFVEDDDEFTTTSLSDRLAAIEAAGPQTALIYAWADGINDATGELKPGRRPTFEGSKAFEYALTAGNIAGMPVMLVRTSAAKEVSGFDERLVWGSDSYFICNILSKYQTIALPKVVAYYHLQHGHSRVTDWNNAKEAYAAIHFEVHRQRFASELEKRPETHGSLLRKRSVYVMECRHVTDSLRWTLAAFRLHPFTLANIRHLLRLARVFIFYATPVSRYRERAKAAQRVLRLRKG